jgi:hypothetical protein
LPSGHKGHQTSHDGKALGIVNVPGLSLNNSKLQEPSKIASIKPLDGGFILENEFVRVFVDKTGTLESIYDKTANREAVEKGKKANK